MLSVAGGLFSRVLEAEDIRQLKDLFEVPASDYWDDHFVFGRKSRRVSKKTGSQATDILIINAVIPVIFVYGKSKRSVRIFVTGLLSFLKILLLKQML